jgi:hypothetical protein
MGRQERQRQKFSACHCWAHSRGDTNGPPQRITENFRTQREARLGTTKDDRHHTRPPRRQAEPRQGKRAACTVDLHASNLISRLCASAFTRGSPL